eukprot:g38756.t1
MLQIQNSMVRTPVAQHEPKIMVEAVFMGTKLGYQSLLSKKWRRWEDLGEMLIITDDMLKAAKNMVQSLCSGEILDNEVYSIGLTLCLSSEE